MFTGIVEAIGRVVAIESGGGDNRLQIDSGPLPMEDVVLGDSIAVNGVCLTVIALAARKFHAEVSAETFACSTFAGLQRGQAVNLERALTPSSRIGGHIVTGHVDAMGTLLKREQRGGSERFRIEVPVAVNRYLAAKGSVTVDGVSLTVNRVAGESFELNIVPHTLSSTTLGELAEGAKVNVEVDIIARYLERLLQSRPLEQGAAGGVSLEMLVEHGFAK